MAKAGKGVAAGRPHRTSEAAGSQDRASRETIERSLSNWKIDPDLAGLRDLAALEKLTPSERQECRIIWSDVEALLTGIKDF
jgi:hypothetical protein